MSAKGRAQDKRAITYLLPGVVLAVALGLWIVTGEDSPARESDVAGQSAGTGPASVDTALPSAATRSFTGAIEHDTNHSAVASPDSHDHIMRQWRARLEPRLRELGEAYQRGELEGGFTMPLFDGEEARINVRRFDAMGPERGTFRGAVTGEVYSLAVFSYVGGVESGTIQIPSRGEVYRLRDGGDGYVRLEQIDVSALGECGVCAELAAKSNGPALSPHMDGHP